MQELIRFFTEQELEHTPFEQVLSAKLSLGSFVWVNDFYEFRRHNQLDRSRTYIALETSGAGFRFYYSVLADRGINLSPGQVVELLKEVCKKTNVQVLTPDHEPSSWCFVLIEPTGQTSTVELDDDSRKITGNYNFDFGQFRTQEKLTDEELSVLKQIIAGIYPDISISVSSDGPVINGAFNKVQQNFDRLRLFDYHYRIIPQGKSVWIERKEKSELFTDVMVMFGKQVKKDLCVFPVDYSEVQNIAGGSDSEEHCLFITGDNVEKIVYKERRKSWLT